MAPHSLGLVPHAVHREGVEAEFASHGILLRLPLEGSRVIVGPCRKTTPKHQLRLIEANTLRCCTRDGRRLGTSCQLRSPKSRRPRSWTFAGLSRGSRTRSTTSAWSALRP